MCIFSMFPAVGQRHCQQCCRKLLYIYSIL